MDREDEHPATAAAAAATVAANTSNRPLSEDEFRRLYQETLRRRHEELVNQRQGQGAAVPAPQPPPQDRWQEWKIAERMWSFAKILLIAGIFANGSLSRGCWIAGAILALKGISLALSYTNIQFVRPAAQNQPEAVGANRAVPASFTRKLFYGVFKCVSTFFISMFPTWRVEKLEAELAADGVLAIG